jgi:hypothetical protein
MPRTPTSVKSRQGNAQNARNHKAAYAGQHEAREPDFVESINLATQAKIIDLFFEKEGNIRNRILQYLEEIVYIGFTEDEDEDNGPDLRFQIAVKRDSPLWKEVVHYIKIANPESFNPDEIDVLKILVGGSRYQVMHCDIRLWDKWIEGNQKLSEEEQKEIRQGAYSILLAGDMRYTCRLAVGIDGFLDNDVWINSLMTFRETGPVKPQPRDKVVEMEDHVKRRRRVALFEGPGLVFDGEVWHSGTPCLGDSGETSKRYPPFLALKTMAEENRSVFKYKNKNRTGFKINKEELAKVKGLSAICRFFIATFPAEYAPRSRYVMEDAVRLEEVKEKKEDSGRQRRGKLKSDKIGKNNV